MPSRSEESGVEVDGVEAAVASLETLPVVLAVSGGRDSMSLLHAFSRGRPRDVRAVATFDHGTGSAAAAAADLVDRVATSHGFRVARERLGWPVDEAATEADWRGARWEFLTQVARETGSVVVTAHTQDDQAETVFLRILRDSSARGLAAMRASSPATRDRPAVVRPFLGLTRAEIAAYAAARGVPFVEDPSNLDRRHGRNRVRLDLLPACERVTPGFTQWLIDLGLRAARWRDATEDLVDALLADRIAAASADGSVAVRADAVIGLDEVAWRTLWPAIAGRAGVVLDRRGVARAASWCARGASSGSIIQLAGGASIERTRHAFVLRRAPGTT